jgi:hypothetical protein
MCAKLIDMSRTLRLLYVSITTNAVSARTVSRDLSPLVSRLPSRFSDPYPKPFEQDFEVIEILEF